MNDAEAAVLVRAQIARDNAWLEREKRRDVWAWRAVIGGVEGTALAVWAVTMGWGFAAVGAVGFAAVHVRFSRQTRGIAPLRRSRQVGE